MTFSAVIRFTGAVITALSIAVAAYGPASSVLAFSVGAAAAYGLMLLTGGDFVIRKFIARVASREDDWVGECS
jgi:uncharacterized membrane protein YjjB (DUF3815 family)